MNVVQALEDRALFGSSPAFEELDTWAPWLDFLRAVYGLPLDAEGFARFTKATGRSTYAPPPGGWREVVCIVGRQSGKTRVASLLVAYEAAFAPPCRDGDLYALLLAQDWRASIRASFTYLRHLFDSSPVLRQSVVKTLTDTLDLSNGTRIATYPCRPASIRGLRARIVLLDEMAFFRSSEGAAIDAEMLTAARPALATTGGKLVIISSPYGQAGSLWDLHRKHHGDDASDVLVWQATAPDMNPTLATDYLERMRVNDPDAYRAEVMGEFRAGISQLLDPAAIDSCVATGRRELPPMPGTRYTAFVDPSGGRADAFTAAVAHKHGDLAVVDAVRSWQPPFNPSGVVAECSAWLRDYRVSSVTGDRYAGEWPREQYRAHGLSYRPADKVKSDLYLALLTTINSGAIELPDEARLLAELRGLERRRGPSGKDRVDHPPRGHDDAANAVAGVADAVLGRRRGLTPADLYGGPAA